MKTVKFESGETVYYNNVQARYVCKVNNHMSVLEFEPECDGDDCYPDTITLNVPTSHISLKQVDLFKHHNDAINSKKAELAVIAVQNNSLLEKTSEYEEVIAEYEKCIVEIESRHKAFARIRDYMDGKITHFFKTGYYPQIIEFNLADYEKNQFTYLNMMSSVKNDYIYRANFYKGDDHSWYECIPCLSYEAARDEARKYLESRDNWDREHYSVLYIKLMEEHNISSPKITTLIVAAKVTAQKDKDRQITEAEEALAKLKSQ